MVADLFDSLLAELAKSLDISDLHTDNNNTCLIAFKTGIEVYIEPFQRGESMLISTNIGTLPPGRYREDVFREALKSNGLPLPRFGTFAYSEQSDQLILFGLLSLRELNGEKIAAFLGPFMEKSLAWKCAVNDGVVPLAETVSTKASKGPMGMFGLRP